MSGILIRGATIVTMNSRDEVIRDGEVLVLGNTIAGIGPKGRWSQGSQELEDVEVIEAHGKAVLPGLVNTHCHAAMALFRGYADDMPLQDWLAHKIWPLERRLSAQDVYWGSLLACVEMIKGGITTFADMYFFMDEVARAVEESGIRASLSRGLIATIPGAGRSLREAKEFCAGWHGKANGRITTMVGPHAPYTCPPSFLEKVMDAARELKVGIHIHLSETRGEVEKSLEEHGKSPVRLLDEIGLFEFPVLAAHCVHLSDEDLEVLAEKKVGVAHNPGSNLKLASGVAPISKMLVKGVKVGLGTDGAASNNNLDLIEEMRLSALIHKGFSGDPTACTAKAALGMATRGGAEALGLGGEIGTIEEGKRADLIIVDLDKPHLHPQHDIISNLVYSARADDVLTTIIDGKIVMKDRALVTLDEKEVMEGADKRAKRVVG